MCARRSASIVVAPGLPAGTDAVICLPLVAAKARSTGTTAETRPAVGAAVILAMAAAAGAMIIASAALLHDDVALPVLLARTLICRLLVPKLLSGITLSDKETSKVCFFVHDKPCLPSTVLFVPY